jgi:hypothetical protein
MNQEDYREEVQKKTSGLRLGSSKDEVRDIWKQVLEYLFPKQTADSPREGFVHKYFNYESDFPHIGIVNPRGEHSYLPVFHVYCQSLPTAEGENILPGARTHWEALEDAVQYELLGIMSLIKECKPNLNALIVAGPLVRFCGVNKQGEYWDPGFDAEEGRVEYPRRFRCHPRSVADDSFENRPGALCSIWCLSSHQGGDC